MGSTSSENDAFRDLLKSKWDISELGPVKYALGISVERDHSSRTISLSQNTFIDRIINRFNQTDARPCDTPMVAGLRIQRPDKGVPVSPEIAEWRARTPYRELVGSLNYVAVATRPDISFAVGRLSTVLDCFTPDHWSAAIRVLRYLKGTRTLCLTLGGQNPLALMGWSDSDWANCQETSRSIGGFCFTLGSGMISWSSRRQQVVADSTCYAEYIALHDACNEALFLRELLSGLHIDTCAPTPIHCDNDAALRLAQDQVWHSRVKHIRVKFHKVHEHVENGDTKILCINSASNTVDILTKPLGRVDFLRLRHYLGL